ncbi:hypothetical protein [Myroides odoratus]|uniref:Uncharacterized protein n=1 Tax=Myroides odoratus TaxID=256 RepID=A0A378RMM8_MYROD|nr:hypothetical protein [Myroides odoratus]QQU02182.1 hypothetical protein I6I89_09880 [Myroides odoratus]STZ26910.1 Uncharacterised protein [Myroides odoratus]
MEEIKNNLNELKEYTMDRLKMPIFFYYFVLLAVWNWDIILLILKSNSSIESVISKIKTDGFELGRYLWPLLIAIFGNILFPFFMYLIDYPLSWINTKRNKKASDVEKAKASDEFKIQRLRTGALSLEALQSQIDSLTLDNTDLSKKLKASAGRIEDAKKYTDKMNLEIEDLKQTQNKFTTTIGFYDLAEEINSFENTLIASLNKGINQEEILNLLERLFEQEKDSKKSSISDMNGYHVLVINKFIEESTHEGVLQIKISPIGIKFMYWLSGITNKVINIEDKELIELYNHLDRKGLLNDFERLALQIKTGGSLSKTDKGLNEFTSIGLIKFRSHSQFDESANYDLTTQGLFLLKYITLKR